MDFLYFDLNYLKQNDIVEAIIEGTECNVILLNSVNFSNYKNNREYHYYGGHCKQSPAVITIPHYDYWYLVIDSGNVKVSVSVIEA
jgi:hypothetical protein